MSEELVESLKASYIKLGPISPAIRTQFGIASGSTRKMAVPEWPEKFVKDVGSMYEHLKIVAASNIHEDKPAGWWEGVVNQAAAELAKVTPREQVSMKLVADFPMSEKKILRYLHEEFKRPEKVKAGKISAMARAEEPFAIVRPGAEGLRRTGFSQNSPSLVGPSTSYPIRAPEYTRRTYTPEEEQLVAAFSGKGFTLDFQHPVPMDKWKCFRCGSTWTEDPPKECPKDGLLVGRLDYKVNILVRYKNLKWSIEPEGKEHGFGSDAKRDAYLRSQGIEPFHFDDELVRCGAWFIVEYFQLLRQLHDPEEHIIAIEGHVRHIVHNTTELFGTSTFQTQRPALVKVIVRS